jgi:hypothetical protein
MEDLDFSEDFCRFIQDAIPAVDAAELLLLFRARPDLALTPQEAVAKLGPGINAGDVAGYLSLFASRGLLILENDRYRYLPQSELAPQVEKLALAYNQRPVTLIRVIYAFRDGRIRSFADAFKLRK